MKWENFSKLDVFKKLGELAPVNVKSVMSGESGAERVKNYKAPMAEGMVYSYAAKAVDDDVLAALQELADEAELTEKYAAL